MKKILKDRYIWAIVAILAVFIIYNYFQICEQASWLPNLRTMPEIDMAIDIILLLSLIVLGANRFQLRGVIIAGVIFLLVNALGDLRYLTKIDILIQITFMIAICIPFTILISNRIYARKEREEFIHQLQDAHHKIKILSGFLPICASCKKIRDDNGYWQAVETYISEHSEAQFTHSLCEDCKKKLYPELYP